MPTSDELYSEAENLKNAGDLEGAIAKLKELVAQDDNFFLAHAALSVFLGRVGRHEDAIRHGLRVCELEPSDPFSFTSMSIIYVRAGRIPEAEDYKARAAMMQMRKA